MSKMLKYGLMLVVVALSACSLRDASPFVDEHRAVAEKTYNAANMNETLEKILQWHQSNQTGLALALNPGKDREAILNEFKALSCQPTEELLQLWAWHNGTRDVIAPFIWYHNFLSVQAAMSTYQQLIKMPLIGWQKNWIPIFEFEGEW